MPEIAAGVLFAAPDGDVLLLLRSRTEANYAGHWALPGGKADGSETAEQCARRECAEELGELPAGELRLIDEIDTPNGMTYSTFAQPVAAKFYPTLNAEHAGFVWAPLGELPSPLHPGVKRVLAAFDPGMDRYDWREGQLEVVQPEEKLPAPAPEVLHAASRAKLPARNWRLMYSLRMRAGLPSGSLKLRLPCWS